METSTAGSKTKVIGDSLALGASEEMTEQMPGLQVDAVVGRNFETGLELLAAQKDDLPDVVVLGLGINGDVTPTQLNQALSTVGPDRKVVFVTPSGPRPWVDRLTGDMKKLAQSNPGRVAVADWNAAASQVTDFSGDQIHVGDQGAGVYARTVRLAVDQIAGASASGPVSTLEGGNTRGGNVSRPTEVNFVGLDPEAEGVEPEHLTDKDAALKHLAEQLSVQYNDHFPGEANSHLGTGYLQTQSLDGRDPDPSEEAEAHRQRTLDGWTEVIKRMPILKAEDRAGRIAQTAVDLHVGKKDLYAVGAFGSMMTCQAADGTGGKIQIPEQYLPALQDASRVSGIPVEILAGQIMTESMWKVDAVSPTGARGIAQFMPSMWEHYGQGADPFDPIAGIRAQGELMRDLMEYPLTREFGKGDPELTIRWALTMYNAGPQKVKESDGVFENMYRQQSREYADKIFAAAGGVTVECDTTGTYTGELGSGDWVHPLPNSILTSPYGPRPCPFTSPSDCTPSVVNHNGLDFARGGDSQVLAPADMRVTMASNTNYGWTVRGTQVDAPGFKFAFLHCKPNSLSVSAGQTVPAGTPLCIEGMSGPVTGVHLHFSILKPEAADNETATMDNTVDPYQILNQKGVL